MAIHSVAAAAQGILRDIARATDAEHKSILHDHPDVPEDMKKQWVNALNEPRNFLKHADRDPYGTLEFYDRDNEDVLLDAVLLFWSVAQAPLSSANLFMGWFTTKNPELREAISGNQIGEYCVRNNISPNNKAQFLELIDAKVLLEPA